MERNHDRYQREFKDYGSLISKERIGKALQEFQKIKYTKDEKKFNKKYMIIDIGLLLIFLVLNL
ncbi:MAG: hypothetical protein Q4A67_05285 [Aerococcus sp.]|nr:hypothetical protein [Aerococcus sp.]